MYAIFFILIISVVEPKLFIQDPVPIPTLGKFLFWFWFRFRIQIWIRILSNYLFRIQLQLWKSFGSRSGSGSKSGSGFRLYSNWHTFSNKNNMQKFLLLMYKKRTGSRIQIRNTESRSNQRFMSAQCCLPKAKHTNMPL